jgi:phosphoglycerate dehydrogenase-like enzyme
MKVCVANAAFSKNTFLLNELYKYFPDSKINLLGKRLSGDELIDFMQESEAAIIGLEEIDLEILEKLPKLKFISKFGVGLNNINLEACKLLNIEVGWTAGVNKTSVAEMTIGFMIMLYRNLYTTSNQLKNKIWNKNGGFQISNKTVGIIGFGNIGQEVRKLLRPFNCKILVNDVLNYKSLEKDFEITCVSKDFIYKNADILTIHTPLNNDTINLFNQKVFELMKPSSILINTARGGIVNEIDLYNALIENKISGAALDVYSYEPFDDMELLKIPNLITTPHIGGNADEAVVAMGVSAIKHLNEYKASKNLN